MDNKQVGVVQLLMMENKKSSEIHVAQALIAQLPELPPGQCFSFDALHTTQATVNAVNATDQDYLLALKSNRAATDAAVETLTQTEPALASAAEQDYSHGRSVHRQVQVFAPTPKLQAQYPNLASVGVVQRTGIRAQLPFCETVYYLSSAIGRLQTCSKLPGSIGKLKMVCIGSKMSPSRKMIRFAEGDMPQ